jgi:23S rRNA pseudouridine1911/1915/1917 synthase
MNCESSNDRTFVFSVTSEDAGRRLDEFLASRLGGLSRMRIARLIAEGACRVNQEHLEAGRKVHAGDLVKVVISGLGPTAMTPEPIQLEILYEDYHLIVVVKPSGMLVHPTKSVKSGTLANALAYHFNQSQIQDSGFNIATPADCNSPRSLIRPGIVHRLDRYTSGLLVAAKTTRALKVLAEHFRRRLVEKRYLALVHGRVEVASGSIIAPIGRDADRRPRWWVMEGGKLAETRFVVLERFDAATLLELEAVTGRTNQLRIHCAYLGHPVFGDRQFSSDQEGGDLQLQFTETGCGCTTGISRLFLHAWRLGFHHPADGRWLQFTSPLPDELARFLDCLRHTTKHSQVRAN